jgi:iron complex outermembrane receptor protein
MIRRLTRRVPLLLFPLLLSFSVGGAEAQEGALTGTVEGTDSGAPLASVEVLVLRDDGTLAARAATGPGGSFRVTGLAPGSYDVSFRLAGWEEATRRITIRAGETTSVSVELSARVFTLNPLTVTTGRQVEKLLDAPASISVIGEEEVGETQALSYMDYVDDLPGVDVLRSGLQQGYVASRGFNEVFSGSLLTLTDYRIARVPSLRANIPHMVPTTNRDIERIEMVRGPGSALYGPNAAAGVMHVITKSPLDDPGHSISLAGGERDVLHGEGRVSLKASDRFGIKLSGSYFRGDDWRFTDPAEEENERVADGCLAGQQQACATFPPDVTDAELERIGNRDFDLERWSLDVRADWRPTGDVSTVFSYGRTQSLNSIDLTNIGAGQVQDWAYQYAQARLEAGDLFAQGFVNWTDAGDTYLLRTGQPIDDESYVAVGQLQHTADLTERQRFVYGADLVRTVPRTNGSINGVHEDDDSYTEVGGYLQSETALSDRWELTLTGRVDHHSVLDEAIFSPRAAIIFSPSEEHSLRATFNRAFATPDNNNLFLDILAQRIPLADGISYGLRAQGTTDRGFTFSRDQGGRPMMKSPFAPPELGGSGAFVPARTETLWQLAVGVVAAQDPQAGALLGTIAVPSEEQVGVDLRRLNTGEGEPFLPFQGGFDAVERIPAIQEETTNTFEVGYKGLVEGVLLLSADVYYTINENFIGPLRVETPNAFLNGEQIAGYLMSQGVDQQTAGALAEQMAQLPLGVITPTEVSGDGANLLLTYRNFGEVDLWGSDLAVDYQATDMWNLGMSLSWVSDDVFQSDDGQSVELNAPAFKVGGSVGYRNREVGFDGKVSYRFVEGFPVSSGVYGGTVEDYGVVDLSLGYELPTFRSLSVRLDVRNLFDDEHRTFVGVPELGRLILARLRYST